MSDDMNPAFGLDDTPDDPDSTEGFGTADDYSSDSLGLSEFEETFPGADSDDDTDPQIGLGEDLDGGGLTSAMGEEQSSDAEEPAGDTDSAEPTDGSSEEPSSTDADASAEDTDAGSGETFETDESDETTESDDSDADSETGPDSGSGATSDEAGDSAAEDSDAAEPDEQTTGEDAGDDEGEPSSDGAAADEPAGDAGSTDAQPGDLTVSIDGENIVVGEPTLDITGDGVADTVVVESDGNVEYYVDTDQDGVADQIIVLDEDDGTLVNHEVYDPGTGTWTNVTSDSTAE